MNTIENIEIKNTLSLVDYKYSLDYMERRVLDIQSKKQKELLWFLNHNHIYTIGTSGNEDEFIKKINIPIIKTNRGGKTTYHGPGQRIVYFLLNLNERKKDIRKFVNLIEHTTIKVLKEFDIEAKTFPDRVGIWVTKNNNIELEKEEKIGAIGLRVKNWVTYHGLSFNIDPDLEYYKNINPCGLSNYSTTSMKKLGVSLSKKTFDELYFDKFLKGLKYL
jgi:lipoyl(octanoyl) transferase